MTEPSEQSRSSLLGHIAFALLISIVITRCLILESIRSVGDFTGGNAARGPGAATSIVLDWLSFVPVLLVLLRRILDPSRPLRFAWAQVLLAALTLWSLASIAWADDKFLALVSAARIAGGAALFWAASQLVTRWDHLRVIVGVVVGILLVNVLQGIYYQNVDLPDLKSYWAANRLQVFEQRGWNENDYSAQRFEMKVLAGEMLNFSLSANVLGALAVSAALAAFAAGMQRLEDKDEQGWAGAMFVAALGSAYILAHTGSKASWAALILGVALLGAWRLTRGWLARNQFRAFLLGFAAITAGVAFVLTLGLLRGGLPSDSLNFRWRYWVGSWQLFLERPLTGVGWGNFGDNYLRHRLPQATEEIQDPHSFPVKWAVELGVIGLTLGVAWLVAWAWSAMPALSPSPGTPGEGRGEGSGVSANANAKTLTLSLSRGTGRGGQKMRVTTVLLTCLLAFVLTLACSVDFSGDGNYAILETFRRAVHVGVIALAIGLVSMGRRDADNDPIFVDDRPAPWLAAGLFAGVVMMLVQSTIDIALFQPGPWVLLVVMMGALIGLASGRGMGVGTHRRHAVILATLSIAWIASAVTVVAPVSIAEAWAAMAAEARAEKNASTASKLAEKARLASPVSNFDYAINEATARTGDSSTTEAPRMAFDRAIAAAPLHAMNWLTRSRYLSSQTNVSSANVQQAIDDFGRAVTLNPQDADLRIEYADLLERFGHQLSAAEQLEAALTIDDKLDAAEPERLELRSPGKRAEVEKRISRLRAATISPSPP